MAAEKIKLVERRDAEALFAGNRTVAAGACIQRQADVGAPFDGKGLDGARHSHPHEQLVYIIRGHIRFSSGDSTFDARTCDSFVVPGGLEHRASALEESEVLDVFTPFREDYAESS